MLCWRRRRDDDRGIVIPLVALVLVVLITFASLAIDIGFTRVVRRDMQALADVMALDLARRIDGVQTRSFYESDPAWLAAIDQSFDRNEPGLAGSSASTVVQLGTVDAVGNFTESPPNGVPLAVKVTATGGFDYYFRPGSTTTNRAAVAVRQAAANASRFGNFMIGSFLLGTDPNLHLPLFNRVLPRLIRSSVDSLAIDAVSYNGLASSTMDIGRLSTELGFGSPDELANAGVLNARDVYFASANVMDSQGDTANAQVYRLIAAQTDSAATVDMGDVLVEQGGAAGEVATGVNSRISNSTFITGTAFAINGNNFISVPGLNFGIPGVPSSTLELQVIQRPEYCVTPPAVHVAPCARTTSQVVVRLINTIDRDLNAVLAGARLTGTVTTETIAAGATGTMTTLRCPGVDPNPGMDIAVSTNPVSTTSSEALTLAARVGVIVPVVVNVATVTVNGAVQAASGTTGSTTFDYPSEFMPTVGTATTQRIGSPSLGLATALSASGTNVTVLGAPGIALGTLVNTINAGLSPALTGLNNVIVNRIAQTLGLSIGGADVGAIDLRCFQNSSLVGEPIIAA